MFVAKAAPAPQVAGARLRELREAAGLSQAELAAEIGCAPQTISNIETERHGVSRVLARRLALRFGLMPNDGTSDQQRMVDRLSAVERELRELRTQLAEIRRLQS